jgi:hypothetical protein
VINFVSDLRQVSSTNKTDRNIVESGIKHHQANKQTYLQLKALLIMSCKNRNFSTVSTLVSVWPLSSQRVFCVSHKPADTIVYPYDTHSPVSLLYT